MGRDAFLNREFISGLIWVVIGVLFCLGSLHYGVFVSGAPGPGLVPIIAGGTLTLLGVGILVGYLVKSGWKEPTEGFFPEEGSFRRVLFATLTLVAYTVVFEYLGFLLTTFVVTIFMLRLIEPKKWSMVLLSSLVTAASFHMVFRVILKIPFPRGYFGI